MRGKRRQGQRQRPTISIVGAGNFASVLAPALQRAGYIIDSIVVRNKRSSLTRGKRLAEKVGARAESMSAAVICSDIIWLCVPDAAISETAQALAECDDWKGKIALHSSGALTSDELAALREHKAAVASVHPLMTFVKGSKASLVGVPFAIEGDTSAVRFARNIVTFLGGQAFSIHKRDKAAYHAWATFVSPLLISLLATSERMATTAGMTAKEAKRRMLPIMAQTLTNYVATSAAAAFSGPIVRGDAEVVKRHLRVLRAAPEAREVYAALVRAAVRYLPGKNRAAIRDTLKS